jgi:23S rRNA (adenine2503-C2)-methyltransferase
MSEIIKNIQVPTGNICIMQGDKGLLEFLSIGDYGKSQNIKADFLGLTEEINGVPNGVIMPLTEKWVITISTQYGCSMGCKFCDVPLVGRGVNATFHDMIDQIKTGLLLHPEIMGTKRLNIHFARMGEPTWNMAILHVADELKKYLSPFSNNCETIHPVISTMMPKENNKLHEFLYRWCNDIKNNVYNGEAGLQLSINSTNNNQREEMFSGNALSIEDIAHEMCFMPLPKGRKYTLNFALADGYEIDAKKLKYMFPPKYFMCKITPIHRTYNSINNGIDTALGYETFTPYQSTEYALKEVGFDVIVFIPSKDEDDGLITCGNAILSGNMPKIKYKEL